jgi:hypothetical protein
MLEVDPKNRISIAEALSCQWMAVEEERLVLRDLSIAQKSMRKSFLPTTTFKAAANSILAQNKFLSISAMFNDENASVSTPTRNRGSLATMDMIDEIEDELFNDSFLWGDEVRHTF